MSNHCGIFLAMGCFDRSEARKAPKYNWSPKTVEKTSKLKTTTFSETRDYKGVMYDFARMPSRVKRYGRRVANFRSGTVKNFGYRNSEEGIHVSSLDDFNAVTHRSEHKRVKAVFDGIYCDYYGENAFTVCPLATATVLRGQFLGRYSAGRGSDFPGEDKCFQVDGGILELRAPEESDIIIEDAARAVRAKANSIIICDNVDFVKCKDAIRGDGLDNPRSGSEYYNGERGDCIIFVRNCRFWDCENAIVAMNNCTVYLEHNNEVFGKDNNLHAQGGSIKMGDNLLEKFLDHVDSMRKKNSNEW